MEKERQERDGSAPCTFQVLSPPMLKDIQLKCSSTSRVGRSSHVGVSLQVGIYIQGGPKNRTILFKLIYQKYLNMATFRILVLLLIK